jgi:hypothetical protein
MELMKVLVRIIAFAAALVLTFSSATYLYRRSHSEKIAAEMVQEYCHKQGYDPTKISGPSDGRASGVPVSYSWTYKDSARHLEFWYHLTIGTIPKSPSGMTTGKINLSDD